MMPAGIAALFRCPAPCGSRRAGAGRCGASRRGGRRAAVGIRRPEDRSSPPSRRPRAPVPRPRPSGRSSPLPAGVAFPSARLPHPRFPQPPGRPQVNAPCPAPGARPDPGSGDAAAAPGRVYLAALLQDSAWQTQTRHRQRRPEREGRSSSRPPREDPSGLGVSPVTAVRSRQLRAPAGTPHLPTPGLRRDRRADGAGVQRGGREDPQRRGRSRLDKAALGRIPPARGRCSLGRPRRSAPGRNGAEETEPGPQGVTCAAARSSWELLPVPVETPGGGTGPRPLRPPPCQREERGGEKRLLPAVPPPATVPPPRAATAAAAAAPAKVFVGAAERAGPGPGLRQHRDAPGSRRQPNPDRYGQRGGRERGERPHSTGGHRTSRGRELGERRYGSGERSEPRRG